MTAVSPCEHAARAQISEFRQESSVCVACRAPRPRAVPRRFGAARAALGSVGTPAAAWQARGLPADARVRICLRGEGHGRGPARRGRDAHGVDAALLGGLSSQLAGNRSAWPGARRGTRLREPAAVAEGARRRAIRGPAAPRRRRRAPPGVWARAGAWLVLALLTVRLQQPAALFDRQLRLAHVDVRPGERGAGEESAYTVFNNFGAARADGRRRDSGQVARGL